MAEYPNGQAIWSYLLSKIGNEYGVAGLMGNLYWESGLIPYRKQGDFTTGYTESLQYTEGVNSGTISEYTFVHDAIGYGLAQWTYYTRKQGLYDLKVQRGVSIGNLYLALDYLWWELNNLSEFSGVLNTLLNASSVREASDKVLTDFENPADQTDAMKDKREATGLDIYNTYHGVTPTPTPLPKTRRRMLRSKEQTLILSMLRRRM